jgi:hypothetical protein
MQAAISTTLIAPVDELCRDKGCARCSGAAVFNSAAAGCADAFRPQLQQDRPNHSKRNKVGSSWTSHIQLELTRRTATRRTKLTRSTNGARHRGSMISPSAGREWSGRTS